MIFSWYSVHKTIDLEAPKLCIAFTRLAKEGFKMMTLYAIAFTRRSFSWSYMEQAMRRFFMAQATKTLSLLALQVDGTASVNFISRLLRAQDAIRSCEQSGPPAWNQPPGL